MGYSMIWNPGSILHRAASSVQDRIDRIVDSAALQDPYGMRLVFFEMVGKKCQKACCLHFLENNILLIQVISTEMTSAQYLK